MFIANVISRLVITIYYNAPTILLYLDSFSIGLLVFADNTEEEIIGVGVPLELSMQLLCSKFRIYFR